MHTRMLNSHDNYVSSRNCLHRTMWYVVLFIVLQSQIVNTFDGFVDDASLYSSRKETLSAMVFHGVSEKCNRALGSLDSDARWQCKLVVVITSIIPFIMLKGTSMIEKCPFSSSAGTTVPSL